MIKQYNKDEAMLSTTEMSKHKQSIRGILKTDVTEEEIKLGRLVKYINID